MVFCASSLMTTVLLALLSVATPIVQIREPNPSFTLPFALKLNLSGSTLADIDRERAQHMISRGKAMGGAPEKRASSFSVTNTAVTYVANVGVGTPPTSYTLLIDTGSSNTWVGAGKRYVVTSSSVNTHHAFSVSYGSGSVSGTEWEYNLLQNP